MGLYITKMIVEQFEGEVWVKSNVGEGSTFGFTFRLSELSNDCDDKQNRILNKETINSRRHKIIMKKLHFLEI